MNNEIMLQFTDSIPGSFVNASMYDLVRTLGASLTILNIRLMRLLPSYAGFSAHISYSMQPSAYIKHNKPKQN